MAGGHGGIQCSAVEICLLSHLVMHLGFGNLLFFLIIGNVLRTVMSKVHGTVKKTMISLLRYLDYARLLFHRIMDAVKCFWMSKERKVQLNARSSHSPNLHWGKVSKAFINLSMYLGTVVFANCTTELDVVCSINGAKSAFTALSKM